MRWSGYGQAPPAQAGVGPFRHLMAIAAAVNSQARGSPRAWTLAPVSPLRIARAATGSPACKASMLPHWPRPARHGDMTSRHRVGTMARVGGPRARDVVGDQYAAPDPVQPPDPTRLVDEYVARPCTVVTSPATETSPGAARNCSASSSADATILLTTSGTHALELIALLLDITPGDEVIVPSFTFSSTVNAFVLRGATPVFIDIRRDTLNLDETRLEDAHHRQDAGDRAGPLRRRRVRDGLDPGGRGRHGIAVVEDNAHGLFGRYRGRPLGTFGCMAAQSFHETKNFSCGEGGAIVINDPAYVERAEIIREKGTNRRNFFRGLVDKYTWVDVGSSYLPSEILAAMLLAQLEDREWVWEHRSTIWHRYADGPRRLGEHQRRRRCRSSLHTVETPYHLFHMLMPTAGRATR